MRKQFWFCDCPSHEREQVSSEERRRRRGYCELCAFRGCNCLLKPVARRPLVPAGARRQTRG
jgi:hypothetical protein